MDSDERTSIKGGSAIQGISESNHDVSVWIQGTIDKLNSFEQRVDDGHMIIMGEDYNEAHPTLDREQVMYGYTLLSIDFVETKPQNMTE